MPLYEFYCPDCHVIFNFFARRVDTQTQPDCPRCQRPELQRKVSLFAISKGRAGGAEEAGDDLPDIDEARLEQAMGAMAGDLESLDENDPKAMGQVMRRLFDATGLKPNADMREALSRIEAGEDPEKVESEMGEVLDSAALFALGKAGQIGDLKRRLARPAVDETFYDL